MQNCKIAYFIKKICYNLSMNLDRSIPLSIIIPAYNEEPNLGQTLEDVASYLNQSSENYEVIVVNDGSTDKTAEIAQGKSGLFKNFRLLNNPGNRGKGYAVKNGVLQAQGESVLFMDADNSTQINQLPKLVEMIDQGSDIAIASRRIPGAEIDTLQPLHRRIMGNFYILATHLILGTNVRDFNCGFKLFTKKSAQKLFSMLTRDDWSFDAELIFLAAKLGFRLKEVPIKWQDKRTSKVKPLQDGIKSLLDLFAIKLRHCKEPSTNR